jgi:hypothetical protein
MAGHFRQLAGIKFGRLLAIERHHDKWLCRCDCGNETMVKVKQLKNGNTKSCGCLYRETRGVAQRTHGLTYAKEYGVWNSMRERCTRPRIKGFENYGGRGISVCERWYNSFENFYADMGPRPSSKHSLDRTDNDGNYEPDNCRWVLRKEQNRNKRHKNVKVRNEFAFTSLSLPG